MTTRARLAAAVALIASAVALAHYTQVWASIPAQQATTSDYAGTYVASTLWRTGHANAMYDVPAEERVMAATGAPPDHLYIPFENPPLAAVVAAPLSLLDAASAYRVWSVVQLGLVVAAVVIAVMASPRPSRVPRLPVIAISGLAVAGFGTGVLFVEGQWDGVSALGIAMAYAGWRKGWISGPGFAIGVTAALAKPHLVVGVLAFMAGRRDWRGLAAAATGGVTVAVAGIALAGPVALQAFIATLLQPSSSPTAWMQGATGLFGSLLGGGAVPYALALGTALVALAAAGWLGARSRCDRGVIEPAMLGAVTLSLFASPHLLGHDLTLLAPVVAATLVWTLRSEWEAGAWPGKRTTAIAVAWTAVNVATFFDLGHNTVGLPGRLTPWVLAACGAVLVACLRVRSGVRRPVAVTSPRTRIA
ncbi:MAG: glycosyltransferase family 87 protein [Candidatus Dormibacteria bacterium]